jgi:hypothetical protein
MSKVQPIQTNQPVKPQNWFSTTYYSSIVAGIFILFCNIGSTSQTTLHGTIVGYCFIAVGALLLVGYILKQQSLIKGGSPLTNILTIAPFIIFLAIVIYMVSILSNNFQHISNGHVSRGYYHFMNVFILLLIVILFVFHMATDSPNSQFSKTYQLDSVYAIGLIILEIVALTIIITINTILKYFSTDG